jgi:hypothetical protein
MQSQGITPERRAATCGGPSVAEVQCVPDLLGTRVTLSRCERKRIVLRTRLDLLARQAHANGSTRRSISLSRSSNKNVALLVQRNNNRMFVPLPLG